MTDLVTNMRDFMYLGSQTTTTYNKEQIALYTSLIEEETRELTDAIEPEEIIKEACDVIVVTLGLLLSMGIDVHKAWNLVYANNISKVSNQDTIVKDENGKIMKSLESKVRKDKMMSDIEELLDEVY